MLVAVIVHVAMATVIAAVAVAAAGGTLVFLLLLTEGIFTRVFPELLVVLLARELFIPKFFVPFFERQKKTTGAGGGTARRGTARHGTVRHGTARHGTAKVGVGVRLVVVTG